MKICEIKQQFENKEIAKADFINTMHDVHKVLFDYAESLENTEIAKIEITDGKVVLTSRETSYHPGGVQFICDTLDKRTAPVEAFNFDVYELADSQLIYKFIEPGYTIFDIGANIGWYSIHMAKKISGGKIYSFEPIPETYQKLTANVALNEVKNIVLNNIAFADKKQTLTFYYAPVSSVAASARNITENAEIKKLECQATTIDEYVKEHQIQSLNFIKCDVEGAELFVYKGAVETLKKYKPVIFTEMLRKWSAKFEYHPNDIICLLSDIGYACYTESNGQLKLVKEVNDATKETNFLFLHTVAHQEKIAQHVQDLNLA